MVQIVFYYPLKWLWHEVSTWTNLICTFILSSEPIELIHQESSLHACSILQPNDQYFSNMQSLWNAWLKWLSALRQLFKAKDEKVHKCYHRSHNYHQISRSLLFTSSTPNISWIMKGSWAWRFLLPSKNGCTFLDCNSGFAIQGFGRLWKNFLSA